MKLIITSLFIVMSFFFSYSQTYYGLKVGMNHTGLFGDNPKDTKFILASHAGGFVETPINEDFAFQGELLYSMQGEYNKYWKTRNNLKYVTANLLAKYYLYDYITLDAGPYVAYLVGATYSTGDQELVSNLELYNKLDAGFGIGGTYIFDDWLFGNLRYNVGFMDVIKSDDIKGLNSNLQISLGYKF